jgi:hypothetical protein
MEDRGRKGTFDVINPVATIPGQRLAPPEGMGADEAQTWRAIVASMPADWFSTCWFMLRALVAHIHNAKFLALALARVRAAKDSHKRIAEINKLTQMHLRESAAITNLSQKLRLAPRAKYTMERSTNIKSHTPQGKRPWEIRSGDCDDVA